MLRSKGLVFGAVALISVFVIAAFATEDLQKSLTYDENYEGRTEFTTWTVCSTGCDFTSIQAAVDAASSGDTIELGPETFVEAVTTRVNLTITGAGDTVVEGDGRAVIVNDGGVLTLSDLIIQNGGIGGSGIGAGIESSIRSAGLIVEDCDILNSRGAGIVTPGGGAPVTIANTRVKGNRGGGVGHSSAGSLTITNCVISENQGYGVVTSRTDQVLVVGSTVNDNFIGISCRYEGSSGGQVVITNSTICGNDPFGGVGVYSDVDLELINTTIAENIAYGNGAGLHGGLNPGNTVTVTSTIIANNQRPDCDAFPNSLLPIVSLGWNLSSDDTCNFERVTDMANTDPLLMPLADNGGPTPTRALAPGSPAIDAGGVRCPPTDQRGVMRPQDGDGDGVARCDIGAYEYQRPVLPIQIDIKPDSYPNSVNPRSRGAIPVAILGSTSFDVANIDEATLRLGPDAAPIAHRHAHFEDVNLDGIMDLLTHFRTRDTGIGCGDESATLTGETSGGQAFEGTDSIQTVGCREGRRPAIWMKDQEPDDGRPGSIVNPERR